MVYRRPHLAGTRQYVLHSYLTKVQGNPRVQGGRGTQGARHWSEIDITLKGAFDQKLRLLNLRRLRLWLHNIPSFAHICLRLLILTRYFAFRMASDWGSSTGSDIMYINLHRRSSMTDDDEDLEPLYRYDRGLRLAGNRWRE